MTYEENQFLKESNAIEKVYDVDSFIQAQTAWEYLKDESKLYIGSILKTHKILMLNQPQLLPNEKGYFRTEPVYIGGHEAMEHTLIRPMLENWLQDWEKLFKESMEFGKATKTKRIQDLHVQYEKIHPFVDGNGRTGRMLMNWQRLKLGLPIFIIHEGTEQYHYYQWFK